MAKNFICEAPSPGNLLTQTKQQLMTEAFKEYEQQGWQHCWKQYEESFTQLTNQTFTTLFDQVKLSDQSYLLDIATGSGHLVHAAMQRGATAIGVDFSPEMIALACKNYPNAEFAIGDAEALSFAEQQFDVATMNFGLLHLSNPEQALRETNRILKPGGRFAFSVWATPDQALGFSLVLSAIERHGNKDITLPAAPPFFKFSNEVVAHEALAQAGFTNTLATQVALTWKLSSTEELFQAFIHGTARTGGLLRAQSPEALAKIENDIAENTAKHFTKGNQIFIPMPAMVYVGTKGKGKGKCTKC